MQRQQISSDRKVFNETEWQQEKIKCVDVFACVCYEIYSNLMGPFSHWSFFKWFSQSKETNMAIKAALA